MRDEDLLLVDGLDDVALRLEGDVVILSEVLADDAHGCHLVHDAAHVDVLARDGLDDLVVVALEVLDVLVCDAVLDEVVVML
jgi:hypothetical protein